MVHPAPILVSIVFLSLGVLAGVPSAPATHDPIVPVMEAAAQNTQPGIRPGAWMGSPAACTFAFVVQDEDERLYITSAGHCVDRVGDEVTIREEGRIGEVVAFRDLGTVHDYALIRIDAEKYDRVDPTMIGWGGPTGLYTGDGNDLQGLKHYGWGSATWYDHSTRCRLAVADSTHWTPQTFSMHGTVLWGDSGSGTMTDDGQALGINTHLNTAAWTGVSNGPRFDHVLDRLSAMTGHELTLVAGRPVQETCSDEPPEG